MAAYLLLLVAVLSRVIPHAPWWSFTAVTGCLLYFGAKRPWREMLAPLAALITADCYLTLFRYHGYSMHWGFSAFSWGWYLAAMVLGSILLRKRVTLARGAAGALLGPTSFFLVSNFGAWFSNPFNTYPHTLAGLVACYWAGVPFYRNDLVATSVVLAVSWVFPRCCGGRMRSARKRRWQENRTASKPARGIENPAWGSAGPTGRR